ncbi:MAG: glycosyltransferase family 4 protein [Actinomycetota bacterium]
MPVHQFLPSLSEGDAIGHHVLRIRPVLQNFGPSRIYVERADSSMLRLAEDYRNYSGRDGSVSLYHASIGTPMSSYLLSLGVPVVVDYHNVTPMHFFAPYEPRTAALCFAGRLECRELAARSLLGIADSDFSRRELEEMGYPRTATIPILLDDAPERAPDPRLLDRLLAGKRGSDLLFVGRIAPQKRQEDLIKLFAVYQRHFDHGARLFLVGRSASSRYLETLELLVQHLRVDGVHLTGGVTEAQLFAHYRAADVFVTMSEHEGFCAPLLEAMRFDLPIVAHGAGAVPETLGDAGVTVAQKRYDEIAALIHLLVGDEKLQRQLGEAGRRRLEAFRPEQHERRLVELIRSIVE